MFASLVMSGSPDATTGTASGSEKVAGANAVRRGVASKVATRLESVTPAPLIVAGSATSK